MQQSPFEVRDPVCGMDIRTDEAEGQSEFEGTTFYFCSSDCRDEFDSNPAHYAGGPEIEAA